MLYRENGQFKTNYRADQQIFPIAQDRIGIRHRVRSSIYQLQRCYQKELAQKPDVMGRLRVSFVVSLKGKKRRLPSRGRLPKP